MSQNTPPSHFGQSDEHLRTNPYYGQQQGTAPDLDANAPLLQSNDAQRLNRKALVFLAGIVGLLIVAAIWMFNSATSSKDDVAKVDEEEIRIPDLPKAATEIQVPLPADDAADLPPLPLVEIPSMQPQSDFASLPSSGGSPMGPQKPTLMERRMLNSADGSSQTGPEGASTGMMTPESYAQAILSAQGQQAREPARPEIASAQPIYNPDTLLVRGTYIRCVMETRIVTDVPGFASCVVAEPTYSINGRRLLLPKGSKVSGKYQNDNINGPRVSVIWDRITTPTGLDVNMASPGVDNLGGAGHPGDYDAHWASRITSALLISMISDAFKYAGAKHGPQSASITNGAVVVAPYESNTARAMERLANQALDRSVNRPPTVTINQGTVVNIYVAKDVDFSTVLR
ncbi:TrbI/VirB10 family protein [Lysobacter sp. CFH 32150]|uniref:TrbI/VirB10 family protein n=1 Tax=Lysobacter sp. CFH 32150 TaxID=2927128 RepID=UPI001FA6B382|nr:TrbI/VirB10 family protein [Lysobacter sp. CFH 32150]MCI4566758.1 hypothetical protein [Lysobacter sp. CFH 32150]